MTPYILKYKFYHYEPNNYLNYYEYIEFFSFFTLGLAYPISIHSSIYIF